MKFSIQSLFRKVKPAGSLETQTALPQYGVVVRAMALLTASMIFLQGPLAVFENMHMLPGIPRLFQAMVEAHQESREFSGAFCCMLNPFFSN
jgi:molybdopterin-biosynthesis enzyme MoeA-like protein